MLFGLILGVIVFASNGLLTAKAQECRMLSALDTIADYQYAVVSWNASYDSSCPIMAYQVSIVVNSDDGTTQKITTNDTSYRFTELRCGTEYLIQVAAVDNIGTVTSARIFGRLQTNTVLYAPTISNLNTVSGPTHLYVSWDTVNGTECRVDYTVRLSSPNGSVIETVNTNDTFYNFTELSYDAAYQVAVFGSNLNGAGNQLSATDTATDAVPSSSPTDSDESISTAVIVAVVVGGVIIFIMVAIIVLLVFYLCSWRWSHSKDDSSEDRQKLRSSVMKKDRLPSESVTPISPSHLPPGYEYSEKYTKSADSSPYETVDSHEPASSSQYVNYAKKDEDNPVTSAVPSDIGHYDVPRSAPTDSSEKMDNVTVPHTSTSSGDEYAVSTKTKNKDEQTSDGIDSGFQYAVSILANSSDAINQALSNGTGEVQYDEPPPLTADEEESTVTVPHRITRSGEEYALSTKTPRINYADLEPIANNILRIKTDENANVSYSVVA